MKVNTLRIPHLIFVYTAIVLMALLCICILYMENQAIENEMTKWELEANQFKDEASQLRNELEKIKRYANNYGSKPEVISVVFRECEKYNIDPMIMLELIRLESDFNPQALSSHGARGLCQIIPATGRGLSKELGLEYSNEKLDDYEFSVTLGAFYLSKLLKMNDNDIHKALTAYNRGPAGMENYVKRTGTPISSYSERIYNNSFQNLAMQ